MRAATSRRRNVIVLTTALVVVGAVLAAPAKVDAAVSRAKSSAAITYPVTIHDVGTFTSAYSGQGVTYNIDFKWDESRTVTIELKSDAVPSITRGPLQLTASGTATSSGKQTFPDDNCSFAPSSTPPQLVDIEGVNVTGLTRKITVDAQLPFSTDHSGVGALTASGACFNSFQGGGTLDGLAPYLWYNPSSLNHGYDPSWGSAQQQRVPDLDLDQLAKKPIEFTFPVNYTETDAFGGSEKVAVTNKLSVSVESDTCDVSGSGSASAASYRSPPQGSLVASARQAVLVAATAHPPQRAATRAHHVNRAVRVKSTGKCSLRVFALAWGKGATPAIWDQDESEGGGDVTLAKFPPALPSGCNPATGSEWIACSTPGQTQLKWPVSIVRGTKLNIASVQFRRDPGDTTTIENGTLIGEVQLPRIGPGNKLKFKRTGINLDGSTQVLTVNNLTSDEPLPDEVVLADKLTIKWRISQSADPTQIELGTSSHPVFVTLGPAVHGSEPSSFISLLYPATKAAEGMKDESDALDRIWQKVFADHRSTRRVAFNPVTGTMNDHGAALSYWQPNWTPEQGFAPQHVCHDLPGLLRTKVATCAAFADYMVAMLQLQGIAAHEFQPDIAHGWNSLVYNDAQYFLVGRWQQRPDSLTSNEQPPYQANPRFPTVIEFKSSAGGAFVAAATQYAYLGSSGQNNDTPPAIWLAHVELGARSRPPSPDPGVTAYFSPGDHALVELGPGHTIGSFGEKPIYDPSYGTGPKANLRAWAKASIVAWARLADGAGHMVAGDQCGTGANQIKTCYLEIHVGSGL